jgi:hypothetical protein
MALDDGRPGTEGQARGRERSSKSCLERVVRVVTRDWGRRAVSCAWWDPGRVAPSSKASEGPVAHCGIRGGDGDPWSARSTVLKSQSSPSNGGDHR